jgi:hypothetical protein
MLYAFAAAPVNQRLVQLYASPAGAWPNTGGNANVVPVVANGLVYVGAYKSLMIFGAGGATVSATAPAEPASGAPRVTGTLISVSGETLTLLTRTGERLTVDATDAAHAEQVARLALGEPYTISGEVGEGGGQMHATSIVRAKPGRSAWPADR